MADAAAVHTMTVAIIGAGIAGLACASRLQSAGIPAVLFDKGRRPGGRLSTLHVDGMAWDFGAQYLRPVDPRFRAQTERWQMDGRLAPWPDGPDGALVGTPSMGSLVAAQCAGHAVHFGTQVQQIRRDAAGWHLSGSDGAAGPFAAVILAIPAEQAAPLLALHDLAMAREAASVRSTPCWSVMVAFPRPLPAIGSHMMDRGPIGWAARNKGKPGRDALECWVIQATPDWSRAHLEQDRDLVASELLDAFATASGASLPEPIFLKAHRWRFACPVGRATTMQWNPRLRLGACGDWCASPDIEGAWLSGTALGDHVANALVGEAA